MRYPMNIIAHDLGTAVAGSILACTMIWLFGCATAPVVLPPGHDAAWQKVEELRIPAHRAVLKRDGFGQIVVQDADLPGDTIGRAYYQGKNPCRPRIDLDPMSKTAQNVLAHEIAHSLLLQHSPNAPHNLQFPRTDGSTQTELATEQEYFLQAGAEFLRICRRVYDRKDRKRMRDK